MSVAASSTSDILPRETSNLSLSERARIALVGALLAFGVLSVLVALGLALRWYGQPFLGAFFYQNGVVYGARSLVGATWAGQEAGLRADDQIVRIEEVTFEGQTGNIGEAINDVLAGLRFDQTVIVEVLRPASRFVPDTPGCTLLEAGDARCTLLVPLMRFPLGDFFGFFGIGLVVAVSMIATGIWLFRFRRRLESARVGSAISVFGAILFLGRFEITSTFQTQTLIAASLCVVSGLAVMLGLYFPYSFRFVRQNRNYSLWALALPVGFLLAFLLIDAASPRTEIPLLLLITLFMLSGSFLAGSMLVKRRRTTSSLAREQATLMLVAILIPMLPLPVWWITNLIENLTSVPGISFSTVYLQIPALLFIIGLAYAVAQQRLIDTDKLLSEGAILAALGAFLVVGYTLVTGAAYILTSGVFQPNNPLAIGITLFLVSALFIPARMRLERTVQAAFFKQRRAYDQRLEQISRALTTTIREDEVVSLLKREANDALQPSHLFVFLRNPISGEFEAVPDPGARRSPTDIRFRPQSELLRMLMTTSTVIDLERDTLSPAELGSDRPRLAVMNTKVLARMRTRGRLNGFMVLGPREGAEYSYDELRFLENLAEQAAAALERAQVILEAERNERELQVLVQAGQALNITMDFDTLLEFIFAQVDKIVRAPNFYIALRDAKTEELSYAFYQEYDERVEENEGVKWVMGRDLMSEVVRTKQPLRVDNYVREMQRRDSANRIENANLRAWIGVPLNAAEGQTLGCFAVASTDGATVYTEEQVRILWSLADLAATAIYKTRLYSETTALADRMKALNEISSGLGALFEDVNALLQQITESAINLLKCEAGALLLVDEQTNELVFRRAFGGSGEDLVGKRIPPNTGIAGRVVATGRHTITRRASNDPDWYGEVGAASEAAFATDSILAVPLNARGKVIGVLEVINRRDKGEFSDDDVNLLTTFASQAAIAIENASMFRQTDEMLAERVKQLFNMQRIDQELNRSLDLQRVVELTVDNAIRESDADAGLLGLVSAEDHMLVVVGSAGYPESILKTGTKLPLDQGIMGESLREGMLMLAHGDDTRRVSFSPLLPGAANQLCVPLITGEAITGALLLESTIPRIFNEMTAEHIQALAEHANTAITNAQLFARLGEANESRIKFVSLVAHELKNPMTSIKGFAEFLLGGRFGTLNERQIDFLSTIRRNAVRVQQLIEDLRDFTAQETGNLALKLAPVDFFGVVIDAVRSQQRGFDDKEQRLNLSVPEDLPKVWGDVNRLIQVMVNLVSNANKYTPRGGVVTIGAEVVSSHDSGRAPAVIQCTVRDTGIGMSEEDLRSLFTPYWRSENPEARNQEGTGLGMSLTRGLVEAHGGRIWVESELGVGTAFHITVPLAAETQAENA